MIFFFNTDCHKKDPWMYLFKKLDQIKQINIKHFFFKNKVYH